MFYDTNAHFRAFFFQLIEGLSYLHNSAKILHGNLTPSCIYITTNQIWKVGGFEYAGWFFRLTHANGSFSLFFLFLVAAKKGVSCIFCCC